MSFSGKKFRRIASENVEELLRKPDERPPAYLSSYHFMPPAKHENYGKTMKDINPSVLQILTRSPPVFSYTRVNADTFEFQLYAGKDSKTHKFKLNHDYILEKTDGSKIKLSFSLDGEDVLEQVITHPDGKVVKFRREFGETENRMIITIAGTEIEAKVIYEVVE